MEVYTVILYVFGATKLIYTGTNKQLAYEKLNEHQYHYMHTWVDDKEIRYEGNMIYQEYEYHNGKKRVIKEIDYYMKNEKEVINKDGMIYKEYSYPRGRKKLEKEIKNYRKGDEVEGVLS